jgi:hypothetical protein
MELIPLIRSSHRLTLDNKTKICNILSRYPKEMHTSLVLELVDCISVGEFELINYEEYEELKYDVKDLKESHLDSYDMRSIAEEAAEKVVRYSFEEIKESSREIAEAHKKIKFFEEQSQKFQDQAGEINESLKAINESILALVDFMNQRKSVNLRTESTKPEILLEDIKETVSRIKTINLRKSE